MTIYRDNETSDGSASCTQRAGGSSRLPFSLGSLCITDGPQTTNIPMQQFALSSSPVTVTSSFDDGSGRSQEEDNVFRPISPRGGPQEQILQCRLKARPTTSRFWESSNDSLFDDFETTNRRSRESPNDLVLPIGSGIPSEILMPNF